MIFKFIGIHAGPLDPVYFNYYHLRPHGDLSLRQHATVAVTARKELICMRCTNIYIRSVYLNCHVYNSRKVRGNVGAKCHRDMRGYGHSPDNRVGCKVFYASI